MSKLLRQVLLTILLGLGTYPCLANGTLKVSKEVTVNTTPDMVWSLLGDFNALDKWHPAVASSTLQGKGTEKGDVRILTLTDGAKIYDELMDYDSASMAYTYKLTESPLPINGYVGTLKVEENSKGTSTIIWFSSFNANGVSDEEAIKIIIGIYEAGLQALSDYY